MPRNRGEPRSGSAARHAVHARPECEAQRGRVATAIGCYGEYLALYKNFASQKKVEQKERATTSEAQMKSLELLAPKPRLRSSPTAQGAR